MAVIKRADKIFKYIGGFISGEIFQRTETDRDEHKCTVVWGQLIRKPTRRVFKNGNVKTDFAIRYWNGGHIIVNIWSDTPIAKEAEKLQAFDRVVVFGTVTRHQYVNKRGEHRETRFLHPFAILNMNKLLDVLQFAYRLMNSPSINKILDNDEADVMESAQEFGIIEEEDDVDSVANDYDDLFV